MRKMLTIVATVAVLGAGAAVFAPAARAGSSRPISGNAAGAITVFAPPTIEVETAGNASHLGKFTRHETITLTGGLGFSGSLTFVAANGDELDADFVGAFTDGTLSAATGTYTFKPTGTGRFDDATGTATFAATKNGLNVSVAFNGSIDY